MTKGFIDRSLKYIFPVWPSALFKPLKYIRVLTIDINVVNCISPSYQNIILEFGLAVENNVSFPKYSGFNKKLFANNGSMLTHIKFIQYLFSPSALLPMPTYSWLIPSFSLYASANNSGLVLEIKTLYFKVISCLV